MYRDLRICMVMPAYNEEKLVEKTIKTVPEFVDHVIVVNDGSTDDTLNVVKQVAKKNKKVIALDNPENLGVGGTLINAFKHALKDTKADVIGVMAADAQCDTDYLHEMIDSLIDNKQDYVKANRFFHREALTQMPKYRRFGNIVITILTKFSTGYYSIFDTQNGYGVFKRSTLENLSFDMIGQRYDYENTLLIALSITNAKIKDHPVPAIYGDEKSTIKFLPTVYRALKVLFFGYFKRIYYKYVIYGFHPIALFLISGWFLGGIGFLFGIYLVYEKVINNFSPSTGSVMLSVLPIILGFQLLLTALIMDMDNEKG